MFLTLKRKLVVFFTLRRQLVVFLTLKSQLVVFFTLRSPLVVFLTLKRQLVVFFTLWRKFVVFLTLLKPIHCPQKITKLKQKLKSVKEVKLKTVSTYVSISYEILLYVYVFQHFVL